MKRRILVLLALVLFVPCLFAADWYISDYDVQITVGRNAVHHMVETITVYFEGPHHGIVREIPLDYRDYNEKTVAKVKNLTCSDPVSTDQDNGYLVMKIGSENRTYTGEKTYTITYDYDLGADYNEGYDLFYLNIIGTEWECPINKATFSIVLPFEADEEFRTSDDFFNYVYKNTHFTTGRYGYTENNLSATLAQQDDGSLLIRGEMSGLSAREGITIKIDLPEDWYKDARLPWDYTGVMKGVNIAVSVIVLALAVLFWMMFGKDKTPIIVARFKAPDGLSPLMVGYVADLTVDDKDVISMLFYWADQGLLSIKEIKNNKYEFTKLKDIEDYGVENKKTIPDLEVRLFNGFFKNCKVGDVITFKNLEKNNFYETIVKTKADTKKYFTKERSLQNAKSKLIAGLLAVLAFFPAVTGALAMGLYENAFMLGVLLYLGAGIFLTIMSAGVFGSLFNKWHMRKSNLLPFIFSFIPGVLMLGAFCLTDRMTNDSVNLLQNLVSAVGCTFVSFFAVITEKRSEYGNRIFEEILGYREFIDKVEIDKLKMMIKEDPDLYYRVLCYAVVLGLEDKWAQKFEGMMIQPPQWYSGYSYFDSYCLARMATRMNRTLPLASVPRSSISGSPGSRVGGGSFGGSGFSGGGFGGGGGHAW